ncbi:MAG: helicase, partial [Mesorhizobium sp.]|nr:helicase [Mesorhizobium sp.]
TTAQAVGHDEEISRSGAEIADEAAETRLPSPLEGELPPQGAEGVAATGSDALVTEQTEASDDVSHDENVGAAEATPPDRTSSGHPPLEGEGDDGATVTAVETTDAEATSEAASAETPQAETAETEAPKPILLWRQQRFDRPRGGQRHDHRGRSAARHGRPADAQGGDQQPGDQKPGEKQGGWKKGRGRPQEGQGEQGERRHGRPQGERPDHRRDGRPDRKGDNRRQDRAAGGKDGGQGGKPAFQGKPREERPARFDPDSPFAKLAALRDQLKK